jgi:hypothetical protein
MSLFETLIIGMDSLNFYLKHLISKKNLSSSACVPLSTVVRIVHRLLTVVVIHKIQLSTKKKRNKKRKLIVIVLFIDKC